MNILIFTNYTLKKNTDSGNVITWLKVETEDSYRGWIFFDKYDPYANGTWSIIDTIQTSERTFTVRKLEQRLSLWNTRMNVRDKPGLYGSSVLFQLIPPDPKDEWPMVHFTITAITEERDTIEGKNDHWVKIIDSEGREGWMFAGFTTVERGGPKYYFPHLEIDFELSDY